ncbi:Toxin YoeB [compost metagenome]|uniref:Putative mRNA interferase YoeB n=1 Tax=Solitalea canadensis (strain ATCC 29591 / DSM 3403 / JCM 21819 / LMG 8368 / NBRC 15130 / NCIMB 12057 / USAM 9D) TaxID=929556 RepID=H8KN14_SOLCM|nr:Txe/YoeB family addiction module toxin [Solitalea canadensis]AFD09093.1 toxin-antitoxin system, toxin component, Txe/YoeB family [Solitalea canadensis DSM 3403]
MKIVFLSDAWDDYLFWQLTDKIILKKINNLIKEIERQPYDGNGKPEPLKHNLAGWRSRRINLEHRLVYRIDNDSIIVLQCRYHY